MQALVSWSVNRPFALVSAEEKALMNVSRVPHGRRQPSAPRLLAGIARSASDTSQ